MFICHKEVNSLKECAFSYMPFSYESWSWSINNSSENNSKFDEYYYLPLHDNKGFYQIVTMFLKYCSQIYNSLSNDKNHNHNEYIAGRCRLRQLPGLLLLGYDILKKKKGLVSFSFFTSDLPCTWVIPTSISNFSEIVTNPGWIATTMLKPKIPPVFNLPHPISIFSLADSGLVVAYHWSSILFLLLEPILVIPSSQLQSKNLKGKWDPHQLVNKSKKYLNDKEASLKLLGSHYIIQYFPKSHLNENTFSIAVFNSKHLPINQELQHDSFQPSDFMKSLIWGISLLQLSQESLK